VNIRNLDLNLLKTFEALVVEEGVGRAARRLGLTQPAVSNALRRLRAAFDDPMFTRVGSSMVPTPRAREMRQPVLDALDALRGATGERPTFDPATAEFAFRVSCVDFGELVLLRPLLGELRRSAPRVAVHLRRATGVFEVPATDLATGAIDLAFGPFPMPPTPGSGLMYAVVAEDRLVAIVDRRSCRSAALSLREFLRRPHVRVNVREGPGLLDDMLAANGLTRQVAVSSPSFLCVPTLVEGTDLIGIVPSDLTKIACNRGRRLRVLPLPVRLPPLRWTIAWHERTNRHPAHEWFRRQCLRRRRQKR
jgi:DNA-binding transcriptional LysR family regulator